MHFNLILCLRVSGRFVPSQSHFVPLKKVVSFHAIANSFHKTLTVLQSFKVSIRNLEVYCKTGKIDHYAKGTKNTKQQIEAFFKLSIIGKVTLNYGDKTACIIKIKYSLN